MGNLRQGRLFVEDAAVSDSRETAHTREELERDGWTDDDMDRGKGEEEDSSEEEGRSVEEDIQTKDRENNRSEQIRVRKE